MRAAILALSFALLAVPVAAQPVSPPATVPPAEVVRPPAAPRPQAGARGMRARFDAANTTHDGHLTLEQARTGRMRGVARNFDAIDATHKGYVTVADIQAYNRARRNARQPAPQ